MENRSSPLCGVFYGTPSTYLWEDEMGVTQHSHGEGGEQGRPPHAFALRVGSAQRVSGGKRASQKR